MVDFVHALKPNFAEVLYLLDTESALLRLVVVMIS